MIAQRQVATQGFGARAAAGDYANDPNLVPRNMKIASIDEETLDPTIQDKLKTLNSAKQKAVESEDFDKAKGLKEVIDKLKLAGAQLVQLETQKKQAIENEDFDSAKVLKYEIDRLRSMAMTLDTDRVILTPIKQTRGGARSKLMSMAYQAPEADGDDFRRNTQNNSKYLDEDQRSMDPETQAHEEFKDDGQVSQAYLNNRSFRLEQDGYDDRKSAAQNNLRFTGNNEELVVPAHNLKKPIDFNTVGDQDFGLGGGSNQDEELKIQNIATSQRPIADAILPFIGEETTLLMFARQWQNREKGITQFMARVGDILSKEGDPANTAIVQVISECLKDKVQQITLKSFALVDSYISALQRAKNVNPKTEVSNTEKMLAQLLDKLADPKFKDKAEQLYLKFLTVDSIDGTFLISYLVKSSSFLNKKLAASSKHIVPRL